MPEDTRVRWVGLQRKDRRFEEQLLPEISYGKEGPTVSGWLHVRRGAVTPCATLSITAAAAATEQYNAV